MHFKRKAKCLPSSLFVYAILYVIMIPLAGLSGSPVGAQAPRDNLEKSINKLRKLYQDTYPQFEKLKILRNAGSTARAEEIMEKLDKKITSRLNEVRSLLEEIPTEQRPHRQKVQEVKSVIEYFDQYQRKLLSNWKPDNPQLFKAFNRQELITRGLASPEMLRKEFLAQLTSLLHSKSYVSEDIIAKNFTKYDRKVQKIHRNALETFLALLNRIEDAQNNEDTKIEKVRQQAGQEWKTFWRESQDKLSQLREGINQVLILYRGREHLPNTQRSFLDSGIRIKKQFSEIMGFQKTASADNLFSKRKVIRDLLVRMGIIFSQRLISLLRKHTNSYMAMIDNFDTQRNRLEEIETEKQYKRQRKKIDRLLELNVFGQFELDHSIEQIRQVPVQQLSGLIDRLRKHYGDKEKKLGNFLERVRSFTIDFLDFAERAQAIPKEYVKRFKQVSFESPDQFQKAFPGPLRIKLNQLQEDKQVLPQHMRTLKQRADEVLQFNFQLNRK